MKNLVVVGDWVVVEPLNAQEGRILQVQPRQSLLSRADNLSRRKEQLIAANVDQVMIVASVVHPPLKPFLLDRYLIAAELGRLDPLIVINKIDLLEDSTYSEFDREVEAETLQELEEAHKITGIPVVVASAHQGVGIEKLRELMQGKTTLLSGQSGVGKSNLLNAIAGFQLRTGTVVGKTGKGAHTTTQARLLPLSFGGWCVDTPGVQSFGVWDLKKEQLRYYFMEFELYACHCKYPACMHLEEPDCAVKEAVEQQKIAPVRYASYCSLMDSLEQSHKRR